MKRENKEFQGILKDKELFMIEDALENYLTRGDITEKEIKDGKALIVKLYDFWEAKQSDVRGYQKVAPIQPIINKHFK